MLKAENAVPIPSLADILVARDRIEGLIHRTPVMTCSSIDAMVGANVFFKCENFQKVGAFKFRGALNSVLSLSDREAARGVGTFSSGNHAQAVALAARLRGIGAEIVMPRNAPRIKQEAVKGYGANVTLSEPGHDNMRRQLDTIVGRTGVVVIPPFDYFGVIAGQGTAALELLDQTGDLDLVLTPVGGGGLVSGTAIAVKEGPSEARVIGAEPAEADDACRSLQAGRILPSVNPTTICDGLLSSLGELTFTAIQCHVDDIVTVSENAIVAAMRHVWERMKIIIEPSAAVPLGALLENRIDAAGQRVGIILSGGTLDLAHLPWQHR